ncbi:MAG: ribose 5-phosphate isomerase B [Alphaproteobacteria bacterium]|nr:ribose 5-phosphate isomerase B [Alphaproteobacteria bacterium]
MPKQAVAIGADHAGFVLKKVLKRDLEAMGFDVLDLGTASEAPVDYPDFGHAVAQAIESGAARWGVAICGSGVGMSIALNRHPAVRAALCQDAEAARLARQHNDANVLALGARRIDAGTARACLRVFLATDFEGGRHVRRVEKLF